VYWPQEIELLRRTGQHAKAYKVETKLERLQQLTEGGDVLERLTLNLTAFDTTHRDS
jgi:hypothetical protein